MGFLGKQDPLEGSMMQSNHSSLSTNDESPSRQMPADGSAIQRAAVDFWVVQQLQECLRVGRRHMADDRMTKLQAGLALESWLEKVELCNP